MKCREDDILYYKDEIKKLLEKAEKNNIHMFISGDYGQKPNCSVWINFEHDLTRECSSVRLYDKYLD